MADIPALLLPVEVVEVVVGDLSGQLVPLWAAVIPAARTGITTHTTCQENLLGKLPPEL